MTKKLTKSQLENLTNLFTYHAPTEKQIKQYNAIRKAALNLAKVITLHCPPCPDQSAAIRLVREATFTANSSIATYRDSEPPALYLGPQRVTPKKRKKP